METTELRLKWLESIKHVDDRFLRMIDSLHESYTDTPDNIARNQLPEEVQTLIRLGLKDVQNDNTISHDAAISRIKERYNFNG